MKRNAIKDCTECFKGLLTVLFRGNMVFYAWMTFLTLLVSVGLWAYGHQLKEGLVISNMREQVSWGFYISNFTFLIGIAAAAVILIIPAYLYDFKEIKKIVVFGELLAVTAVVMALSFVLVDMGRPERMWHAIPGIGTINLPRSILSWDMLVLNGYLFLNLFIALYIGSNRFLGREPNKRLLMPLILLSIPWAVGIHTVTAFVYNGLAARPFWNASILAPRFLASAFCSGPALMIVIFQILRKVTDFRIQDRAIFKLAEIVAYAMAINLFLLFAEIYKEYYSATIHLAPMTYLFQGLHGHTGLVPWIWTAVIFNTIGFFLFLIVRTRQNFFTLNIGCALLFTGVWIEKGMGLIIPGFIPDALGEIYEYSPSLIEVLVSVGIWASGAIMYTLFVRMAIGIDSGKLRHHAAPPILHEHEKEGGLAAGQIMTANVITVTGETTVRDIGTILVSNRISGVPVVDSEGRVIGIVSESDIIYKEIRHEPHLLEKLGDMIMPELSAKKEDIGSTAAEIMTSPVITAGTDLDVSELIRIIEEKRVKRIVIVDKEERPVGIVSRIDVLKALGKAP